MEELIEKVEVLKSALDSNDNVIRIKELNKAIREDSELLELIRQYHSSHADMLRRRIYDNDLIKKYKVAETDLNVLIMQINKELKVISNKGNCI